MLRRTLIAALLITASAGAETFDRVAVSIGNQVITESAILLDLRVSAFLDRVPVNTSAARKRESAERLVDQLLILRDATESHLKLPTADDVAGLMDQVRAQYATPQEYSAALRQYQISEQDVIQQLVSGLAALTFTDLRFRPGVQVTEDELRAYYNSIQDPASFEAQREEIEEVIARQRISDALDKWLADTRALARVQFREQVFQ